MDEFHLLEDGVLCLHLSHMYISFWRSFERLDFTPNWRSVNSINLKWIFGLCHLWK
jgi:hypothetical protein